MLRARGTCIAASTILLASAGCQNVEPQVAPGFQAANLEHVQIGQAKAEVLQTLGSPLAAEHPSPNRDQENLHYARPGARWWFGEYRTNVRGVECRIGIREDRVVAIVYADPNGSNCFCNTAPCPEGWLSACLPSSHK